VTLADFVNPPKAPVPTRKRAPCTKCERLELTITQLRQAYRDLEVALAAADRREEQ
jgi:hypothetical protein